MATQRCPACHTRCDEDDEQCPACGTPLGEAVTAPGRLAGSDGALWLDDLDSARARAVPMPSIVAAEDDEDDPPPVHLTLREIEAPPPAPPAPPAAEFAGIAIADPLAARFEDLPPVFDEIELPTAPAPAATASPEALALERAARRAEVRRARLQGLERPTDQVPEVLVVDVDDGSRAQLVTLLLAFGFGVHSVAQPQKAHALLDATPFVAVFADVPLDGSDDGAGISLCKHAKVPVDGHAPLLIYVARAPTAIDRVRAQLAGCDDMIPKPPTRGHVAGVLDMHGIALPSDARRA